jgi:hypothetical protein
MLKAGGKKLSEPIVVKQGWDSLVESGKNISKRKRREVRVLLGSQRDTEKSALMMDAVYRLRRCRQGCNSVIAGSHVQ